jgi:hypothetical protein
MCWPRQVRALLVDALKKRGKAYQRAFGFKMSAVLMAILGDGDTHDTRFPQIPGLSLSYK